MVGQRPQACDQTWIEVLDLFQNVTIGVLFGPPVNPHKLAPLVNAKLGNVTVAAVDFSNPFQMRLLRMKSSRKARIKIGRENRPNQTSEHEIGEMIVANADAMYRLHQIEKNLPPEFVRAQKVLDNKREIFCQPLLAPDEPAMAGATSSIGCTSLAMCESALRAHGG